MSVEHDLARRARVVTPRARGSRLVRLVGALRRARLRRSYRRRGLELWVYVASDGIVYDLGVPRDEAQEWARQLARGDA